MMPFADISFYNPFLLGLLLLLPLLWWYRRRQGPRRYPSMRLPRLEGVQHAHTWRSRSRWLLPALRYLALAAGIVALARPQTIYTEEKIKAEGIDIVLVMDLSTSMLAQDFQPNRLEVSKQVAQEFVSKRPYDRLGLVIFSGEAFTRSPLTTDHRILQNYLAQLQCGILKDGTAIGMGLATAVNRLKDSPGESKVVVLLTDGVNNSGYIQPMTATEMAKGFGIKVYTIGVGTVGRAMMPRARRSDGSYVYGLDVVEIDTELLTSIAGQTGGAFYRATNPESLQQIYDEIDRLEKTEVEVTTIEHSREEFVYFGGFALLCLLLEALLRFTIFRTIP